MVTPRGKSRTEEKLRRLYSKIFNFMRVCPSVQDWKLVQQKCKFKEIGFHLCIIDHKHFR